jgi:predicted small secreted protein
MNMKIAKTLALIIYPLALCITLSLGLSACNTVHGLGKDVSATGHAVSKAARNDHN